MEQHHSIKGTMSSYNFFVLASFAATICGCFPHLTVTVYFTQVLLVRHTGSIPAEPGLLPLLFHEIATKCADLQSCKYKIVLVELIFLYSQNNVLFVSIGTMLARLW